MSQPRSIKERRASATLSRNSERNKSPMNRSFLTPKKAHLDGAYQIGRDELLEKTKQDLILLRKDPLNAFLEKKKFETGDLIVAIERSHMRKQGDQPKIDIVDLVNEKPKAILDCIGLELRNDYMKKKIEEDMSSFLPANQNSVVENIRKKVDGSKFRDSNQEIIVSNLFNEEKRDKLLDVSLLKEMHTDYLYKKEHKILEQELQKNKEKFPLLKVNYNNEGQSDEYFYSKHIRKNPVNREQSRGVSQKMYFIDLERKKKKMEFIKSNPHWILDINISQTVAMDINKERSKLIQKRRTDLEILEYLLAFKKSRNERRDSKEFLCLRILRRIYFTCSHRDILENRQEMNGEEFKEVFKKLKLFPEYINLNQIYQIFGERTDHSGKDTLNVVEFIECFKKASQLVYHSNELASRILDNMDEASDGLLVWMYNRFIHTEVHRFTLPDHAKLEKPAIQKLIQEFNPVLSFLFTNFANSYEDERLPFEEARQPIMPFAQAFEMFSLTGLFPHRCEKEALKFYFDYTSPTDEGLDFENFTMFMALMGIYIINRAKKTRLHEKKIQVGSAGLENEDEEESDHVNSYNPLPLPTDNEVKLPKELPEMLKVFFESSSFIGPLWTLRPKIQRNESILRVDDINTKKRFYNRNKFNKSLLNYIDSNIAS